MTCCQFNLYRLNHRHPDAASGASLQLMDRLNLEPLATTARGIKLLHLLATIGQPNLLADHKHT